MGVHPFRPPLANTLFDMDRGPRQSAAEAFPRAAPALMAARADVAAGNTIEATLTRLQAESTTDPRARTQLMALRFYLQSVLTEVSEAWDQQAVRQTSYVSMLDQLARWQHHTGEGLCLITFNYDTLLERACTVVFGYHYATIDDYQAPPDLHVYKPHGSVNWAQPGPWHHGPYSDSDAARRAICDHPDLQLEPENMQVRSACRASDLVA